MNHVHITGNDFEDVYLLKGLYRQHTSESYITVFFLPFSSIGVIHLKTFDNFRNLNCSEIYEVQPPLKNVLLEKIWTIICIINRKKLSIKFDYWKKFWFSFLITRKSFLGNFVSLYFPKQSNLNKRVVW